MSGITHSTIATLPDEPGAEVNKNEWNASHLITESGGQALTVGAISDGEVVKRVGTVLQGAASSGGPSLETNGTPNGDQTLLNLKDGTNVTVADDGAGGVTISSSGGVGATWVTKTANYNAVAGDYILCNTTGGGFTITLPGSPSVNDAITIKSGYYASPSLAVTIARNGNEIMDRSEDMTVNTPNLEVTLVYNATTGWTL